MVWPKLGFTPWSYRLVSEITGVEGAGSVHFSLFQLFLLLKLFFSESLHNLCLDCYRFSSENVADCVILYTQKVKYNFVWSVVFFVLYRVNALSFLFDFDVQKSSVLAILKFFSAFHLCCFLFYTSSCNASFCLLNFQFPLEILKSDKIFSYFNFLQSFLFSGELFFQQGLDLWGTSVLVSY